MRFACQRQKEPREWNNNGKDQRTVFFHLSGFVSTASGSERGHRRQSTSGTALAPARGTDAEGNGGLLADDFDNQALAPLPIEFGVIDLLPCAQVETSVGDGQQHLMMDQQIF